MTATAEKDAADDLSTGFGPTGCCLLPSLPDGASSATNEGPDVVRRRHLAGCPHGGAVQTLPTDNQPKVPAVVESGVDDAALGQLAYDIQSISGVIAVALGGSRARGTHRPDSDIDIGVYYRGGLDVAALTRLAASVSGQAVALTAPGGWGPWVDGGGWLNIDGQQVDWIYRDLDRVQAAWRDCQNGRYQVGHQPGHPLGFYSHAYAGEAALCAVLSDPTGELADLRGQAQHYPQPLGEALVAGMWEAEFALQTAQYAVASQDAVYAAGCLFRAVGVACQALHGRAGRWLINEKGMVASAASLILAPHAFGQRAARVCGQIGIDAGAMGSTVQEAAELIEDVRDALQG